MVDLKETFVCFFLKKAREKHLIRGQTLGSVEAQPSPGDFHGA